MKYQPGQAVILLDTEFKPAVHAVIKEVNNETQKYLIEFCYPGSIKPEEIWVSQDRLSLTPDLVRN